MEINTVLTHTIYEAGRADLVLSIPGNTIYYWLPDSPTQKDTCYWIYYADIEPPELHVGTTKEMMNSVFVLMALAARFESFNGGAAFARAYIRVRGLDDHAKYLLAQSDDFPDPHYNPNAELEDDDEPGDSDIVVIVASGYEYVCRVCGQLNNLVVLDEPLTCECCQSTFRGTAPELREG